MANSSIKEIKQKTDLVTLISEHISLEKFGTNYRCVCPFHKDTKPSMIVSPQKQIYKCFVCGATGDAISFMTNYLKLPFGDAVETLAKRVDLSFENKGSRKISYSPQQQRIIELLKEANDYFMFSLENNYKPNEYLTSRKIDKEIIEKFSIGYAPDGNKIVDFLKAKGFNDFELINASIINANGKPFMQNRITFAIKNRDGDIVGFSGRTLSLTENIKYLNSMENTIFKKGELLYNYDNAKPYIQQTKQVYVAEGFMDVIALHKAKINNVVAIMGTSVSDHHLRILHGKEVNLILDSDRAGVQAMIKSIKVLYANYIKTYVILDKQKRDPDELLNTSLDTLMSVISNKTEGIEFIFKVHKKKYQENKPENIEGLLSSFKKYLDGFNDVYKYFYVDQISEFYKIDKAPIRRYLLDKKKIDLMEMNDEQLIKIKNWIEQRVTKQ